MNCLRTLSFWAGMFIIVCLLIAIPNNNIYPEGHIDEWQYSRIVKDWKINGSDALVYYNDNKPISFLAVQYLLSADKTHVYTRILAYVLMGVCALIMYRTTKRYESFAYPIIPLFLNSMWLTVEIIEITFILLSFQTSRFQGVCVGLATAFRPYAIVYSVLLDNKKQIRDYLIIGIVFVIVLLQYGVLFQYLDRATTYAIVESRFSEIDYIGLALLPFFLFAGSKNIKLFTYGMVSCVPLVIHVWSHYLLVPYSILFYSFIKK